MPKVRGSARKLVDAEGERLSRWLKTRMHHSNLVAVAKGLGLRYPHLAAVLRGARPFSPKLERLLADSFGLDVTNLRNMAGYFKTEPELPSSVNSPEDLGELAMSYEKKGEHERAKENGRIVEAYYIKKEDYLKACKWASFVGMQHRYLGEYDEAVSSFNRASEWLRTSDKGGRERSWNWVQQKCRTDEFRTWVQIQVRSGDLEEARREYKKIRTAFEQNCKSLVLGGLDQKEVDVETSGLERRMAEIDYLQGHYKKSFTRCRELVKQAQSHFHSEHAVWSLFGKARAQLMMEPEEALPALKLVHWAAKHYRFSRAETYAEMMLLQYYLAQDKPMEFGTILSTAKAPEAPEVKSPRREFYYLLLEGVASLLFSAEVTKADKYSANALDAAKAMGLARELSIAQLFRAVVLLEMKNTVESRVRAGEARDGFAKMKCRWGTLRAGLLLWKWLGGDPVGGSGYEGKDAGLLQNAESVTTDLTPAELLRNLL